MNRSRFSEEQIIGILKEPQAGLGAKELCRKHGLSQGTFYKFKSQYGGMEVSDARKLKSLETANAKLKKLLVEQMMDVSTLKKMPGSRPCSPLVRGQWSSTFEARYATQSCELGHERETL